MSNKIREVNGVKIYRRYCAGSIFSGLICLGIVALTVLYLVAPWMKFTRVTVPETGDPVTTVYGLGVLDLFKALPSFEADWIKETFGKGIPPSAFDLVGKAFVVVGILLWVVMALFTLVILFIGLEFLFRGKVKHSKLAYGMSWTPTILSLVYGAGIGVLLFVFKAQATSQFSISVGVGFPVMFVILSVLSTLFLGIIYATSFKNKVFVGDLGDLRRAGKSAESESLNGPGYTTKEVVRVRYEPAIGLPSKISSIGGHAFAQNQNLQIAMIPMGISSLGQGAFANCGQLKIVSIPASVKSIGYNCFFNCSNLKRVNYGGTKEQWRHVKRGSNWLTKAGTCTVVCCDGSIVVNPYH